MRNPPERSGWSFPRSILAALTGCTALTVLLSSCGAPLSVEREPRQGEEGASAVRYSIVCVVHADGDYLYHDSSGNEHHAGEEALAGATRIAQENPHAEVFIYYQRPRRHFLFVFPLHDGEFSYYRNGRLTGSELYWRDQGQSHFDPEVELYRRFRTKDQHMLVRVFLYCGHEIPEFGGRGYDASYPDRPFTVQDLTAGLKGFAQQAATFDLVALSTCFGGTPYTIGAVGSFARYIIASPGTLHLSYFDMRSLERLDLGVQDGDVHALAGRFARRAFDRLTRDTQTAVSIAVYDVDRVRAFVDSVRGEYERTVATLNGRTQASMAMPERGDCAGLPSYLLPTMRMGVEVLYRPARFGRSANTQNHSGWECWIERRPETSTSQTTEPVLKPGGRLKGAAGETAQPGPGS